MSKLKFVCNHFKIDISTLESLKEVQSTNNVLIVAAWAEIKASTFIFIEQFFCSL